GSGSPARRPPRLRRPRFPTRGSVSPPAPPRRPDDDPIAEPAARAGRAGAATPQRIAPTRAAPCADRAILVGTLSRDRGSTPGLEQPSLKAAWRATAG